MEINDQTRKDISELLAYVEDNECRDFREYLMDEDLEDDILTEDEVEILVDSDNVEIEAEIILKALYHPKINHIYTTIHRLSNAMEEA